MMPVVDDLLIIQDGRVATFGRKDDVLREIQSQRTVSAAPSPQGFA